MTSYIVANVSGDQQASSRYLEEAINNFACRFLHAKTAVGWASETMHANPSQIDGAIEAVLTTLANEEPKTYEDQGDRSVYKEKIWIFEPRKRLDQIIGLIKGGSSIPDESDTVLQELPVLVSMIDGLTLEGAIDEINEVLPAHLRCRLA